jgi:hypothetical protein
MKVWIAMLIDWESGPPLAVAMTAQQAKDAVDAEEEWTETPLPLRSWEGEGCWRQSEDAYGVHWTRPSEFGYTIDVYEVEVIGS